MAMPTQEDHEAAAQIGEAIAGMTHTHPEYCGGKCPLARDATALITAALSEAARVAVAHERRFLISCPWCGEKMNGAAISSQITHLIDCGDKRRGGSDAQATPAPEKPHVCTYECANTDCEHVVGPATPAPEPIHTHEGRGECDACSDESADDAGFRGTPPETGEKEKP